MNESKRDTERALADIALASRKAARQVAAMTSDIRDGALHAMSEAILRSMDSILQANGRDIQRGHDEGMSSGLIDRLTLTPERLGRFAEGLLDIAAQPDPIGAIIDGRTLPNGLNIQEKRVPIGVVAIIYEARPNVTIDAAGLAIKSGNAVLLRGGSAANESNKTIVSVLQDALESVDLPRLTVQTVDPLGRPGAVALMRAHGLIDVLIPRGGKDLIDTVVNEARVPVIETGVGNCHVYVDEAVDIGQALSIVLNSKVSRYSVCNAAETLLVNQHRAGDFLPLALQALHEAGVRIHGDDLVMKAAPLDMEIMPATEEDWAREYLDMEIAIAVVDNIDQAIEHINRYSSGHTEAICTTSILSADQFVNHVDSAVVNVNASTRFTDGGQFGLGAELGISTQKLHARGPMGLSALTTSKWIVSGEGQVRE